MRLQELEPAGKKTLKQPEASKDLSQSQFNMLDTELMSANTFFASSKHSTSQYACKPASSLSNENPTPTDNLNILCKSLHFTDLVMYASGGVQCTTSSKPEFYLHD